tara:strand:- start:234 stop:572 length:339 start_codon:yes stop_codon:yes gene_type:complete
MKKYFLTLLISSNFLIAEDSESTIDESEQVVCSIGGAQRQRNEEQFLDTLNTNLKKEGCIKGDILVIRNTSDTGLTAAYVCDIKRKILVFTTGEVLCTYQGHLSKFRTRIHS